MWNDDSGDWQGLTGETERPRYEEIARMINEFCPSGSVLDVGCGEAVLADYLPKSVTYEGIEPSAKASKTAAEKEICHHTSAEEFAVGTRKWDCIIFNEMLYYSRDPQMLLEKFSKVLNPKGIIIVSIYQKRGSWRDRLKSSMNNARCTGIVKTFISSEGWVVDRQQMIGNNGREPWWLLVTRPRS